MGAGRMTGVLARRRGVMAATAVAPAPFSPLDIPWYSSYWCEGPAFDALGLADGAAVSSMPDEKSGFGAATQATAAAQPTYRAADANFNSKPALDGDGGDWLRTATGTSIGQPCTVVAVGKFSANGQRLFDGAGGGNYQGMLYRTTSGTNRYFVFAPTGVEVAIADDLATHLFIVTLNGSSSTLQRDATVSAAIDPGTASPSGVTLLSDYAGNSPADKIAFYGVIAGTLTTQQKDDLLAWSRSHYATP